MSATADRIAVQFQLTRLADRYIEAQDEQALDELADHWADVFLDALADATNITEKQVSDVLEADGLTADHVNALVDPGTNTKEAASVLRILGGLVLKGLWHLIVQPFVGVAKLIKSKPFRDEVKASFKRALRHEARATRHMLNVAGRLARGEPVKPQERKAAMHQFIGLLTKAVLIYVAGPRIAHLFSGGIWKALATVMSPIDEIVLILLDKPIRAATKKLMNADLGLMPSGFYTHFN
jgi:hypothetical protein